jgi:hypothetical protein
MHLTCSAQSLPELCGGTTLENGEVVKGQLGRSGDPLRWDVGLGRNAPDVRGCPASEFLDFVLGELGEAS